MLKLYKQLKAQTYLEISNIMIGNTILLNYGAKNGIYTVKSVEIIEQEFHKYQIYEYGKVGKGTEPIKLLHIITENYEIFIRPEVQIPVKDGKWIIRSIPISGRYWLMKGRKLDYTIPLVTINGSSRVRLSNLLIKRTKNKLVKVEYFDDPIKCYSDSKTEEILTQKNTSKYSKVHKVHIRGRGYGKYPSQHEFKEKLIEFEYNKNNFLIPFNKAYMFYDRTFDIPNDVVEIGKRCFSGLHFEIVNLPNHKIIFKSGALLNSGLIPSNVINSGAIISLKNEFTMYGGFLTTNQSWFGSYHEVLLERGPYGKSSNLGTDFYIDSSKLNVGNIIKFPIYNHRSFGYNDIYFMDYIKTTVLDVQSDKFVLDIGTFSLINGKFQRVG